MVIEVVPLASMQGSGFRVHQWLRLGLHRDTSRRGLCPRAFHDERPRGASKLRFLQLVVKKLNWLCSAPFEFFFTLSSGVQFDCWILDTSLKYSLEFPGLSHRNCVDINEAARYLVGDHLLSFCGEAHHSRSQRLCARAEVVYQRFYFLFQLCCPPSRPCHEMSFAMQFSSL